MLIAIIVIFAFVIFGIFICYVNLCLSNDIRKKLRQLSQFMGIKE